MNEAEKRVENEFETNWNLKIASLKELNRKLNDLFASVDNSANSVELIGILFDKVFFNIQNKQSEFQKLSAEQKSKLLNFVVKNYGAILLLQLDDIIFLKNGRILSEFRKTLCSPEDIAEDKQHYWHDQFDILEAEKENPVALVKTCIDFLVRRVKIELTNFDFDWKILKVCVLCII